MTLEEAFYALKERYGSHSAAARALGINTSYYRDIRNGRACPSERLQEFLIYKAQIAHVPYPLATNLKEAEV